MSNDLLYVPDEVTVTVRLTINGAETTTSFVASLICESDGCDKSIRNPATLEEVGCETNGYEPEYLTNFEGVSYSNQEIHEWYVPYKNYILTKVRLWTGFGNNNVASGFEVTFSPDN